MGMIHQVRRINKPKQKLELKIKEAARFQTVLYYAVAGDPISKAPVRSRRVDCGWEQEMLTIGKTGAADGTARWRWWGLSRRMTLGRRLVDQEKAVGGYGKCWEGGGER